MPTGTPYALKCPRCKRGKYGHGGRANCRPTGKIERRRTRSQHKGHGNGGYSFRGHRGQVRCGDCGYEWFSTLPNSGRERCHSSEPCTHAPKFAVEPGRPWLAAQLEFSLRGK